MWKRAKIPYFPPFLIHGTWWENGKAFHSGGGGEGFPHGFHVESTGKCGRGCFFFFLRRAGIIILFFASDSYWGVPCLRARVTFGHSPKSDQKDCLLFETAGFKTSSRAMTIADSILHSTRSQKFSCIVSLQDCLSNSAAAADWFAEQRFRFYRRSA